jgi:hypothetical protein
MDSFNNKGEKTGSITKASRYGKHPIATDSKENVTEPCSHCYSPVG